ncbi:cupin domain-containing protein [Sulfurovum sp. XGS-02]|uniref:cupin domain-containing protein n=1 Tax=Sulfurovum sp. XGS-02 TaxID=2925411 RepID=UPI002048FC35|nr:cupin domain-containing protein [Sulfurovum sp. XGS-02]UPT78286.1 cupin domain-containing protein [Sulfurovum sp. XGS-02]
MLRKILLSLFVLTSLSMSDEVTSNKALSFSYNDTSLAWGPCPAFLGEACQIAVLHGDPAKENLDIFFKVPADYAIPHHWHTSAERMILVSGKMTVTYDNQESELLTKGMYAYGPSKHPHTAYCEKGEEPCVLFIAFEEPIDAFEVIKETKE